MGHLDRAGWIVFIKCGPGGRGRVVLGFCHWWVTADMVSPCLFSRKQRQKLQDTLRPGLESCATSPLPHSLDQGKS